MRKTLKKNDRLTGAGAGMAFPSLMGKLRQVAHNEAAPPPEKCNVQIDLDADVVARLKELSLDWEVQANAELRRALGL
jgi:uncharacterized protein (DUF4415 family)